MTEFCAVSHADADLWERRYGAHPVQSRFGTRRAPFLVD